MPIPLELELSGQANADGNAQLTQVVRAAYWSLVWCTASTQGSANWVFGKPASPRCYQQGSDVVLGPLVLAPGEQAVLTVAGATAKASIQATLWGWQGAASDGSDLAAMAGSVQSAGSLVGVTVPIGITGNVPVINATGTQLSVLRQQQQLAGSPFTAASGTTTTQTFSISPSAHAVAVLIGNSGGCSNVTVTGQTSGIEYLSEVPSSSGPIFFAPIVSAIDSTLTVSVTTYSGQTSQVWVAELDDPEAVAVVSNSGFYEVVQRDPFGNLIGVGDFLQQAGYSSLATTEQWSVPAPWQAPQNVASTGQVPGGTQATLKIPAVSGKTTWLHHVTFAALNLGSYQQFTFQIYQGSSSTGTLVWEEPVAVPASSAFVIDRDVRIPDGGKGFFLASSAGISSTDLYLNATYS
jgi:hypothetical protein